MRLIGSVALVFGICLATVSSSWGAAKPKIHSLGLGAVKRVPYSLLGDPAGAQSGEKELRVRPLIVDGKVKEWTTGDTHDVTDRSFVVRRALRINDALPTDKVEHWVWQRGPWLLIDRVTRHDAALRLPDYDPAASDVVWFRDYAAYCGIAPAGKQMYAIVSQVGGRKPVVSKKLMAWDPADHPTPACAAAVWQRDPLRVTFHPTGAPEASFDLVGLSAVLVEDGDASDDPK
jgi:hypothetical protein